MGLRKGKKIIATPFQLQDTIIKFQSTFVDMSPFFSQCQGISLRERACFSTTVVLRPIFFCRKAKDFQIPTGCLLTLS